MGPPKNPILGAEGRAGGGGHQAVSVRISKELISQLGVSDMLMTIFLKNSYLEIQNIKPNSVNGFVSHI